MVRSNTQSGIQAVHAFFAVLGGVLALPSAFPRSRPPIYMGPCSTCAVSPTRCLCVVGN